MKISTKGRYGLRAIVDLAINSAGDHVALYSIAQRQGISENYLEQMFSTLRKAGLVKSVKGAQGGYILAAKPSEITIGTVLRVLEGNLSIIDDDSEVGNSNSSSLKRCLKENLWDKINDSINVVVDSITVEDIVNEYNKRTGNLPIMYYI
ncbi:MAG: Rrf2 family transcriptional regulator [Clostridiaceae bacterium]|nr:Rrf2 family transcriptional regulator [Clostridiaceae bacterium]